VVEQFLTFWAETATYFKHRRGYVSTQLHPGITGSGIFLNIAVWESAHHLQQALADSGPRCRPG
jgi:hypothetical protein